MYYNFPSAYNFAIKTLNSSKSIVLFPFESHWLIKAWQSAALISLPIDFNALPISWIDIWPSPFESKNAKPFFSSAICSFVNEAWNCLEMELELKESSVTLPFYYFNLLILFSSLLIKSFSFSFQIHPFYMVIFYLLFKQTL